ncbi:hypothetical protein DRN72_00035 [Methanosarcinales archaeon]|nr:MAG: hypothetical protein DRN72_00035 [Methanosarcinales archaeon]
MKLERINVLRLKDGKLVREVVETAPYEFAISTMAKYKMVIADEDADFRRGEIRKQRVRPIYLREESVSVPCPLNHHALVSVLKIGEEGGPQPVESERKREYAIVITHRDEKVLRGDLLAVLNVFPVVFVFTKYAHKPKKVGLADVEKDTQ